MDSRRSINYSMPAQVYGDHDDGERGLLDCGFPGKIIVAVIVSTALEVNEFAISSWIQREVTMVRNEKRCCCWVWDSNMGWTIGLRGQGKRNNFEFFWRETWVMLVFTLLWAFPLPRSNALQSILVLFSTAATVLHFLLLTLHQDTTNILMEERSTCNPVNDAVRMYDFLPYFAFPVSQLCKSCNQPTYPKFLYYCSLEQLKSSKSPQNYITWFMLTVHSAFWWSMSVWPRAYLLPDSSLSHIWIQISAASRIIRIFHLQIPMSDRAWLTYRYELKTSRICKIRWKLLGDP